MVIIADLKLVVILKLIQLLVMEAIKHITIVVRGNQVVNAVKEKLTLQKNAGFNHIMMLVKLLKILCNIANGTKKPPRITFCV